MRKITTILFLLVLFLSAAEAQNRSGLGVGIIIGEPTGLTLKTWTGSTTAFDLAAAWSFSDEGSFHVHADYLIHSFSVFNVSKGSLPFYYGVGGRIKFLDKNKFEDDAKIGVRIPLGLAYHFSSFQGEIFLEGVPLVDLIPETDFTFNAALGFRIYL